MKIIAGRSKGKSLTSPTDQSIRPTLARVRKSFFDMIGSRIDGADVLDLYAGAGTLGIEALARGASKVVFVDSSKNSIRVIRSNARICGFESNAVLVRTRLPEGVSEIRGGFDIVFIDPPYGIGLAAKTLESLSRTDLLRADPLILVQIGKREELLDHYGKIVLMKKRSYGDTLLYLYGLVTY